MILRKILLGAAITVGAMTALAVPASAYIACNSDGDCWHTERRYHPPGLSFQYHPDDWYFHERWDDGDRRHWRSDYHRDRGYWRNGLWVTF